MPEPHLVYMYGGDRTEVLHFINALLALKGEASVSFVPQYKFTVKELRANVLDRARDPAARPDQARLIIVAGLPAPDEAREWVEESPLTPTHVYFLKRMDGAESPLQRWAVDFAKAFPKDVRPQLVLLPGNPSRRATAISSIMYAHGIMSLPKVLE